MPHVCTIQSSIRANSSLARVSRPCLPPGSPSITLGLDESFHLMIASSLLNRDEGWAGTALALILRNMAKRSQPTPAPKQCVCKREDNNTARARDVCASERKKRRAGADSSAHPSPGQPLRCRKEMAAAAVGLARERLLGCSHEISMALTAGCCQCWCVVRWYDQQLMARCCASVLVC